MYRDPPPLPSESWVRGCDVTAVSKSKILNKMNGGCIFNIYGPVWRILEIDLIKENINDENDENM